MCVVRVLGFVVFIALVTWLLRTFFGLPVGLVPVAIAWFAIIACLWVLFLVVGGIRLFIEWVWKEEINE